MLDNIHNLKYAQGAKQIAMEIIHYTPHAGDFVRNLRVHRVYPASWYQTVIDWVKERGNGKDTTVIIKVDGRVIYKTDNRHVQK